MIHDVLFLLKDRLNEHLNGQFGGGASESAEDRVVFLQGDKIDPITFRLGAVTTLLINLEEENVLRAADQFRQVRSDGSVTKVEPELRLNLYVLFVARFKQYDQSLYALSMILRYFQHHRVLDRDNAPELAGGIEKLILELVTLPFSDQNEIWNALRTTYHPSVLYKVRMLAYLDESSQVLPRTEETVLDIAHRSPPLSTTGE
jgi:hypothetical protein